MANKGLALMGTGSAAGAGRAIKAATDAISSPLLEDISINGATGIIINITGSDSLTMHETNEAVTLIMEAADENAEIIFGTVIDNNCGDEVKVTVIATGLGGQIRSHFGATLATKTEAAQTTSVSTITMANVENAYVAPIVAIPARAEVNEERDIFAPKKSTTVSVTPAASEKVEDRSDFDRFMNDRNSYSASQASNEEDAVTHSQNEEPKQPSRLIQSIRDAANRYETAARPQQSVTPVKTELDNRAKSIAEKLGFINFDEDEFDTPSYLRKEEKVEVSRLNREFKNNEI